MLDNGPSRIISGTETVQLTILTFQPPLLIKGDKLQQYETAQLFTLKLFD